LAAHLRPGLCEQRLGRLGEEREHLIRVRVRVRVRVGVRVGVGVGAGAGVGVGVGVRVREAPQRRRGALRVDRIEATPTPTPNLRVDRLEPAGHECRRSVHDLLE